MVMQPINTEQKEYKHFSHSSWVFKGLTIS